MNSFILLILATLRVSTPLLFGSMGGLVSERSGVINIALEGMMLSGSFGAAAVALKTGSPEMGALAGMISGVLIAAIYGFSVITLRANQIVAGMAINMLAAGGTPFLCKIFYDSAGSSPSLALESRFHWAPMAWAWVLVGLVAIVLKQTPFGLWLRFAGENPEALDSAGVRVNRIRWTAVLLSGAFAGLGGATLSTFLSSSFSRNMTAGRGFMAIAALIFGNWKPIPTAVACLIFGLADAVQTRLQGVTLWGSQPVPVQFIQILPYVATMVLLAGSSLLRLGRKSSSHSGKTRSPKALGLPFYKA